MFDWFTEIQFVVVYQCSISNAIIILWMLKYFCIARFTLCENARNTLAASWNLSNYYLALAWIVSTHTLWHSRLILLTKNEDNLKEVMQATGRVLNTIQV